MKLINFICRVASFLFCLGIVAIILTIVQPMDPEIDKMFRIGAGIVMVVCLVLILGLGSIAQKKRKRQSSQDLEEESTGT